MDAHLFRATLESVIYGFRHHVEVLESKGYRICRVMATKGGDRPTLWHQIATDCLGRPIIAFPRHTHICDRGYYRYRELYERTQDLM